jgi:hypothetical protein
MVRLFLRRLLTFEFRCLRLWEQDRSHIGVLELARQLAPALDNIVSVVISRPINEFTVESPV